MKNSLLAGLLFFCLLSNRIVAQDRVILQIPAIADETEYVLHTIRDIRFFEEHGYQLALPSGLLIEKLKDKARNESLSPDDLVLLTAFMRDSVYKKADYSAGYAAIHAVIPQLEQMIQTLEDLPVDYFRIFDPYIINLTLYGPGGSYDPDKGAILIYTTAEGRFKQYNDPLCTLIHEIIHISIEKSVIQANQVPHPVKEAIVDRIVMLLFGDELPGYRMQQMGVAGIDTLLRHPDDLIFLNERVHNFVTR